MGHVVREWENTGELQWFVCRIEAVSIHRSQVYKSGRRKDSIICFVADFPCDTIDCEVWEGLETEMETSEKKGLIGGGCLKLVLRLPGVAAAFHRVFRSLAGMSECAPLTRLLFEEDYRLLRELLARDGHAALKAIVLDGDPAWFSMIARSRSGVPLTELLFQDDAALLRHVCRMRGNEALAPVLASLGASERVTLARALLFAGRPGPLELLTRMDGFLEDVLGEPRLQAMLSLSTAWEQLRPLLPADDAELDGRIRASIRCIAQPEHVRGRILDAITEGNEVRLAHGTLRFACRHSLWTLLHEILLKEDYYFACDSVRPRIIDCGAHMGMAIYYFKWIYPQARITAFEPHPALRAMAEENVARNGWDDVEVLPHALAPTGGEAAFHVSETWSMAGSLLERRAKLGDEVSTISVSCVPLGNYLREPVDFLKLDIEGAELEVLEEASPWLPNVGHIFCEVHQGGGLGSDRLARILALLEGAGFDVQVAKSHNYGEVSRRRPLAHFEGTASTVLWARRRRRYS
jgi:FkbM family methyltransferase